MDKIYDKCCGVDVHKKLMVACFRQGRKQEIREFGATTRELLEMADWLKSGGCEMIAMESTGMSRGRFSRHTDVAGTVLPTYNQRII